MPGWCCLDLGWVLDFAGFDPEADRRVLDVGCGNANYLAQLRRCGLFPTSSSPHTCSTTSTIVSRPPPNFTA